MSEAPKVTSVVSLARRVYDSSLLMEHQQQHQQQRPSASQLLAVAPWKLAAPSAQQHYPPFRYLPIRRRQNESFADSAVSRGVALFKSHQIGQAEACYKESLDLVPTHVPTLVAYGALCGSSSSRKMEAQTMLARALQLDPDAPNARTYLNAIQQQPSARNRREPRSSTISIRTNGRAMEYAMAESALLKQEDPYPLLDDDDDDDDSRRKRKKEAATDDDDSASRRKRKKKHKKRKKKHKKKKKKKRRRRRHDSSSDSSSSDDDRTT